jgi:hypothetical protein
MKYQRNGINSEMKARNGMKEMKIMAKGEIIEMANLVNSK